jgi:pyridoxine 5-phosphate synthase
MELTVVVDSVIRMREQQLWPYPDPRQFAAAAENAGADGILASLNIRHVAARDRDWREFDGLARAGLCIALAPDSHWLAPIAASAVSRCVLVPARRHEHSSGGSLAVGVVRELLESARRTVEGFDIQLGARIDPLRDAVRICADAGLDAVELNTAAYALAGRVASRARRIEALRECVSFAHSMGLRVSVRGGIDFENVGALADIEGIHELRIGQAIVSRALFDGVQASIARMRNLLGD